MKKLWKIVCLSIFMASIQLSRAWATSMEEATTDFSTKILTLFQGPLVKITAGIVLFVGVAGLLRGRHQVAVSCGVAFVLLLMLPVVLQYFGASH